MLVWSHKGSFLPAIGFVKFSAKTSAWGRQCWLHVSQKIGHLETNNTSHTRMCWGFSETRNLESCGSGIVKSGNGCYFVENDAAYRFLETRPFPFLQTGWPQFFYKSKCYQSEIITKSVTKSAWAISWVQSGSRFFHCEYFWSFLVLPCVYQMLF